MNPSSNNNRQHEQNVSFLAAESKDITVDRLEKRGPLPVSEHLYQATLARNKAMEAQRLQAKVDKELKEMEECTF